jgi:hypothetical protein
MQDEREVPESGEERLVEATPDPNGAPQPVKKGDPVLSLIATLGVIAVAVGGTLGVSFMTTTHTAGATRSAKLQWEERQRLIEEAQQQELAEQSPAPSQAANEHAAD